MALTSVRLLARQMEALDQVHDSVIATDLNGFIASWNAGAERLHGYTAAEVIGTHVSLLYAPEDRQAAMEKRAGELLKTGFQEFEATALTKSGRRHRMHERLSLIRDRSNAPAGVLSFAIDTGDLERLRTDLRDHDRQLRTLLDAIPLYVAHVDTDLRFRFANRAYHDLTQRPPSELIGSPVEDLLGSGFAAAEPTIRAVLAGRPATTLETFTKTTGEQLLMRVERVPDVDDAGRINGYFVVCSDVTENQRAEAARLDAERRLREALVAEIHHRVKNILQGVVGLLRAQAAERPEVAAALDSAIAQVLAASVGFGLMSTRGATGVDICNLIREITVNQAIVTGAQVEAVFDIATDDAQPALDQTHSVNIALVLNELILNAAKHATGPVAERHVNVHAHCTARFVRVRISSQSGPLPENFNFEAGTGLGMGLNLVRLLLPPHGATVTFESSDTDVVVSLALDLDELQREGGRLREAAAAGHGGRQ